MWAKVSLREAKDEMKSVKVNCVKSEKIKRVPRESVSE